MRWILDDTPFGALARVAFGADITHWPSGHILVADATAAAAAQDRSGRRPALLAARSAGGDPVIEAFQVTVGSPAGQVLYQHLRKASKGTANLAEHQSIAWALTVGTDAVFVARDQRATYLALSELGRGRVCHLFELWRHLLEQQMITTAQYESLNQHTLKDDSSLPGVPWRWIPKPP